MTNNNIYSIKYRYIYSLASHWDAICFTRHPCPCPCPYFPNAYNSVTLYPIPFIFQYISGPRMGFLFHI